MKTNKKNKKHIAAGLALTLLVSGTFAWQSFSQEATNEIIEEVVQPGARLHDYFNGSNKDVFVENYGPEGGTDVFARIQLSEYFEYGKDAGMGTSDSLTVVRGDIENSSQPEFGDDETWDVYDFYEASAFDPATNTEDVIRKYRDLTLGGETDYMPTFNLHPYSLDADVNGTFLGTAGDGRENKDSRYDNYVDYSVVTTVEGDEITPDPADPKNPASADVAVNPGVEHEAKPTAVANYMSMDTWVDGGCALDDVWVFDTDGWAYYAKAIPAASATGLLLDGISITSNPSEEWYYAINVTAQFASAGDWGVGVTSNANVAAGISDTAEAGGTGMYAGGMTDQGLYLLNKAAGLVTVENMTITQGSGADLTANDALLSNLSTTFAVSMDVIGGMGHTNETNVVWTVTAEGSDTVLGTGTNDTFEVTTAMTGTTGRYVLTATSALDASKSVSITLHDGTAAELPDAPEVEDEPETPTEAQWVTDIKNATALDPTSTVTIDGVEWYVLEKGTKTNEEGQSFNGAFLYMKEPLKVDGEYTGFVFQDVAEDGYDASSWKMSDLRGTLAGKLADYPTLAAAAQSVDTTVNGYTSGTPETTYDKFFPLSEAEFTGYTLSGTDIAKDTAGYVGGYYNRWLRSAYDSTGVRNVSCSHGALDSVTAAYARGVRPALWVSL